MTVGDAQPDGSVASRYELLECLGTGGFGSVHKARQVGKHGFAKLVAVKVAARGGLGEDLARLRDEGRMLALVRHRAIVQVEDLVEIDGLPAIVMELVDGPSLARFGAVPPSVALEIVGEVASALHVAFTMRGPDGRKLRLVHRDVKPANILVTADGGVKLLDFGIARANFREREAITMDVAYGSLGYMSPERIDGTEHPHDDVYALGVVLAELLIGRRLGRTTARRASHEAYANAAVREVIASGAPAAVAELVGDMLAYEPDRRPPPRDVERRCSSARPPGEALRDWAERVVPTIDRQPSPPPPTPAPDVLAVDLPAPRAAAPDPLAARAAPPSVPEPAPPPIAAIPIVSDPPPPVAAIAAAEQRPEPEIAELPDLSSAEAAPSRMPWLLLGAGAVVLACAIVGVAAAAMVAQTLVSPSEAPGVPAAGQPPPTAAEPATPPEPAVPAEVAVPPVVPATEASAAPVAPAPEPAPAPSTPATRPRVTTPTPPRPVSPPPEEAPPPRVIVVTPTPTSAPAPTADLRGTVMSRGATVVVVADSGRFPTPGAVPAGTWAYEATFADGPVVYGTITVPQDGIARVRCDIGKHTCSP